MNAAVSRMHQDARDSHADGGIHGGASRVGSQPNGSTIAASEADVDPATVGATPRASKNGADVLATPVVVPPREPAGGADVASATNRPSPHRQADALLLFHADALDGWEDLRIATENRVRFLTSDEEWGKGVPETLPEVQVAKDEVEDLRARERGATLALQRSMRRHPLGPFIKGLKGVGDKQAARLLAAIGDPYWHSLEDRPRLVSELWAYCGYHVVHGGSASRRIGVDTHSSDARGDHDNGGQSITDTHTARAAVDEDHAGDRTGPDARSTPVAGVAPRRKRGQQSNWSSNARKRAWLVVDSAIKHRCAACRDAGKERKAEGDLTWHAPPVSCTCANDGYDLRAEYDRGRVKYADATRGGEPLTDAHKDARARRLAAKLLLKLLWREAKRLREVPS